MREPFYSSAAAHLGRCRVWSLVLILAFGVLPRLLPAETTIPGFVEREGVWVFDDPFPRDRPRATGLQHEFPQMPGTDANPVTPEKVDLGRLLFFDPLLSGDNSMSCATCHHPDFGLADGRPLGMGVGGTGIGPDRTGGRELTRNTPTLWNAAFNEWQFWDGRERMLEAQAPIPIMNPDEMAEDPERLVTELRDIPEYVGLFEQAFETEGPDAVTLENVVQALTSFERTLLSYNSRFDRYAAGDFDALNEDEKNGLKLFRSLNTRCFECHSFPTFSDGSFRVLGVPDEGEPDLGRGGAMDHAADASFKVPSLRNVELTAPYMHNGSLPTLEEVVKFYSEGGGRREEQPVPMIDDKIRKFDLTPRETADLVAFLKSLTDTSLLPQAPARVPSGLPVVAVQSSATPAPPVPVVKAPAPVPMANQTISVTPVIRLPPGSARPLEIIPTQQARLAGAALDGESLTLDRSPSATFHVLPGQSIQAALDRALPGDRLELGNGVYHQEIEVRTQDVTISGTAREGERSILEGEGRRISAISVFVKGLSLEHLTLQNYVEAGITVESTDMPNIEDILIH